MPTNARVDSTIKSGSPLDMLIKNFRNEPVSSSRIEGIADMAADVAPQTERMMKFFVYEHLPPKLQEASRPFCELANRVIVAYPPTPERTVCLRKLLEAKDCAVRILVEMGEGK